MFKCFFVQCKLIINSAVSILWLEIFHMRGIFAQLRSRKTFSGGVVYNILCTYWEHFFPFMKKKVTDDKISTLQTTVVAELGTPVLGAPSMTVWTIASCKVENIADPNRRKNLFHSLVNNSSAESFSRLQLGKTSSHVENFKS